jgi:myo-inositol-1(or 4)-monophosphatase
MLHGSVETLLDLAVTTATAAGELLLERPVDLLPETKSTPTDVVTIMDQAAEALIVERLRAARPDDGLLGEEGTDVDGTSGLRWIIDPLDGTVNYLYGWPFWAVAIGCEEVNPDRGPGDPSSGLVGVVHAPALGWTFTAVRGRGARRNGEAIGPSACTELSQALIGTGFSYSAHRRRAQGAWIAELLPEVRDVRRQGSGALDLCLTASGLLDAYAEQGMHPWDFCAAGLVALEAGCAVSGLQGRPVSSDLVVSAAPGIADDFRSRLSELSADAQP